LALIRPANAAAQLVLRTQAGRKEQGPTGNDQNAVRRTTWKHAPVTI